MLKTKACFYFGIFVFVMLFQAPPAFSETESEPARVTALVVTDTRLGDGTIAISDADGSDKVVVHYTGWIYDAKAPDHKGKKYYSTVDRNSPLTIKLGAVLPTKGLNQSIAGMKVGGKRTLTIPPELAYGSMGKGIIPPNSALVVDVELLNVIVEDKP